jgi:CRISPR-associated protein Cas1
MDRVVDVSGEDLFLHVNRGFLCIERLGEELGRVSLDDIAGLIAHAPDIRWSNSVFTRLAERGVPIVICSANHAPTSLIWPIEGHHLQGAHMRAQIGATRPLQKQLWRQIVSAKILMQGAVLKERGLTADAFNVLARRVRSGDPDNVEALAARRYWKLLFGGDFRRDQNAGRINGLLNYGYAVLRAAVSRAICASGLHPTLGIFHSNRANAFALADDLMEPYRPLVDNAVWHLVGIGVSEVCPDAKRELVRVTALDLEQNAQITPLGLHAQKLAQSLAASFGSGKAELCLPITLPTSANNHGQRYDE